MNRRYYETRRAQSERPAAGAPTHDPQGSERIVALAREHHLPLHQDAGLVDALARLEIGAVIPRELYTIVAEVLAFVYALDRAAR